MVACKVLRGVLGFGLAAAAAMAHAAPTEEWASSIIGASSEWSSGSWAAAQALGEPDTSGYGDIGSAWAPGPSNGTLEYISVGFATPTFATGALIRETFGNGFVYRIDAIDMGDSAHVVWVGADPSLPGAPVDFVASWAQTGYLVKGLTIHTDTNHDLGAWEEIDAIKLYGNTTPVPEPAAIGLWAVGLAGLLGVVARRRRR